MAEQLYISQNEVMTAARNCVARERIDKTQTLWGVPRGGIPAAFAVAAHSGAIVVDSIQDATVIVDDIWDSGRTAERIMDTAESGTTFVTLFDKRRAPWRGRWLIMPWETVEGATGDESATDAITRLLQYIGEDPKREGLLKTPDRVLKAWREWCSGYGQTPKDILTTFEDGADRVNELVVMRNIPVHSTCEHHLAPFFGTATIGYIPNGRIVGLSKLVRLTNIFARRLQVQERLTNQIADALMEHLNPLGVGVIIECRHMCMESRGVQSANTPTTTSALRGALFSNDSARAEFLQLRLR